MKLYCGIDLHSNNHLICLIDQDDTIIVQKRLPNSLEATLELLMPYHDKISGVAVESTYNWYWLVDGLMAHGFHVHLVNTAAVKQYDGLKYSGDRQDAFFLARLMRLGILPTGYIYPKEIRPIRDLLRRRCSLVKQSTAITNSLGCQIARELGVQFSVNELRKANYQLPFAKDSYAYAMAQSSLCIYSTIQAQIDSLEAMVLTAYRGSDDYQLICTIKGVGKILGLTIALETGNIQRFKDVGNYASYCRCVQSIRNSNHKKKGTGNRRAGNKYLAWAYSEAAHFIIRFNPQAERFYQRKKAKRNGYVALNAVAHKIARAVYYLLKNGDEFDIDRAFG